MTIARISLHRILNASLRRQNANLPRQFFKHFFSLFYESRRRKKSNLHKYYRFQELTCVKKQ